MAVRVVVHINASPERVFDAAADHETFLRSKDGTTCMIVRAGATERNGLGCIREVRAGRRARYVEEIVAWDRPNGFEYLIRETSLPIRHEGSRLAFIPRGTGTDVTWTARFAVTVPVIGGLLRVWLDHLLTRAFTEFLRAAKQKLEAR